MEQPSRRTLLRGAVLAAAAVSLPLGLAGSASGLAAGLGATRLRRGVFLPHVGTSFLLTLGAAGHLAELVAVSDPGRPAETRFSLVFRVTGARPADGIYSVSHPRLKAFDLYVGAIGDPALGLYEAVVDA